MKWLFLILILTSCSDNTGEDMRIFMHSLSGLKKVNIVLAGNSNSKGSTQNEGVNHPADLPINGTQDRAIYWDETTQSYKNFELYMNCGVDQSYGWNVSHRIARKYVSEDNTDFTLLQLSQGGARLGQGGAWGSGLNGWSIGSNLSNLIEEINASEIKIDILIWWSAANDCTSVSLGNEYEQNLRDTLQVLKDGISRPNLPILLVKLGNFTTTAIDPGKVAVKAAQEQVASDTANVSIIIPDNALPLNSDGIHYTNPAIDTLAIALFDKIKTII